MLREKQASVLPDVALYAALILVAHELAMALIGYVNLADKALNFPFPLAYNEGPVLDQILRLARDENIYRADLQTPPYTLTSTTPLFQFLQVPFIRADIPTFWYGRMFSIISLLLSAVLIGFVIRSLAKDCIAAVVGGSALLCFPHLAFGSILNQPDMLALALSLGALLLLVCAQTRRLPRLPTLMLAALLCAVAICTHPRYFVAVPLGGLLWLWRSGARRQAVIWIGLVVTISALLLVSLNAITGGGFWAHVVAYNTLSFNFINFTDTMLNLLIRAAYVLIGAGLLMLV
jgi:hypothetical protein